MTTSIRFFFITWLSSVQGTSHWTDQVITAQVISDKCDINRYV